MKKIGEESRECSRQGPHVKVGWSRNITTEEDNGVMAERKKMEKDMELSERKHSPQSKCVGGEMSPN